jgi:hypothetical protein
MVLGRELMEDMELARARDKGTGGRAIHPE